VSSLGELREAANGLRPEHTAAALGDVFAAWRAPGSPWQTRLLGELDTWSEAGLELGLTRGLESWTADHLLELCRRADVANGIAPGVTAVWLADSVPTATFAALALPLLAGSAVIAHAPASDPATGRLFAEALAEIAPTVAEALRLGAEESALERADAVIVHGSDETVATLRQRVPVSHLFVGYGHRLSAAVLGPHCDLDSAVRNAALDVAIYDGRGCLSPAWVLVVGDAARTETVAERLAGELDELRDVLPRGAYTAAEALALRELRATAALADGGRVWSAGDVVDHAVMLAPPGVRPAPGALRHVAVVAVDDAAALAAWCSALAPHLSSLGHAGFADERDVVRAARMGGASRVCPLGQMQFPPIGWRHDGLDPLGSLLRYVDVESE